MSAPQTKTELIDQIRHVQQSVSDGITAMSTEQFTNGTAEAWSAADYVKHLILSIKPTAKAMKFPSAQLIKMFGQPERPAKPYAEIMAMYKQRLVDGIRAEDYDAVVPVNYRYPEGMTDEKQYLIDTWNESNNRLLDAAEGWSEEELDTHQMPHPAIGMISLREMLYFTLFHNTLHWNDIQQAASTPSLK